MYFEKHRRQEMFWIIFSLVVTYFDITKGVSVCNKTVALDSNETTIDLAPQASYPLKCTWNLTAPKETTIVIKVVDILLEGSFDRVIFLDGTDSNSTVLQQCGVGCSLNDAVIVSSKNSTQVIIEMDKGNDQVRLLSIFAHTQDQGGRLYDTGEINFSNGTSNTVFYQLHSTSYPDVKQMQLYINDSLMNPTSTIKVYDGISDNSTLLANFRGTNQFFPTTGSGRDLLVVAQNMGDKQQHFSGRFNSIAPGCHKVSPGPSGQFSLDRKELQTECDWLINPTSSGGNILLEMTSVNICGNETVVIFEGLSVYGQRLATINKELVTYPKFLTTTQRGLSIFVKKDQTDDKCTTSSVISGTYTTVPDCSANLKSYGTVRSPFFPNQYPLNAVCNWSTKPMNRPASLYVTLDKLDLTNNNTITVTANRKPVIRYTGSDLPSDLVTMVTNGSSAGIQFDSNTDNLGTGVEIPGQGFQMKYRILDCGESLMLSNGTISSMTDIPAGAKECIWVITVPPKSGNGTVNIVSFKVDINATKWQNLELRDGGRHDSPLLSLDASKGKPMTHLTRYNKLWIRLSKNATVLKGGANNKPSFNIFFQTYSCDSKHQCKNGICLHPDWKCNGMDDCGDNTDEAGCSTPSSSKGVKIWLTAVLCVLCFLVGGILVMIIPVICRRWKLRNYSQFKDFVDPSIS